MAADRTTAPAQRRNKAWWTENPMTYDWHGTLAVEPLTKEWFEEIDSRFLAASYPYLSHHAPFDQIMPESLAGMSVLEIGCGMGLHTQQLAERGAAVTAIDLTEPAVAATRARMALAGLPARVEQADAEDLLYESNSFDLVWSWGVIHHSSRTAWIMRQIARVLRPEGEARIMVYNRDSIVARLTLARHYLSSLQNRDCTPDEVLWANSDGAWARHYTADGLEDVLRAFFSDVSSQVLGQEADVVPLPSRFRKHIITRLNDETKRKLAAKHGSFLFATARNPIDP